jgi:ribosomal protein S18 acetylase RimI-like enzyme
MSIRTVEEDDLEQISSLYKNFFKNHNVFRKGNDIITAYLMKELLEREDFLLYEEEGLIKGALILVAKGRNSDGSHKIWKFRHFAFETENIGQKLLKEAEKRVKELSKTVKIELTISETEEGIDFYKENGYEQEGSLKNHFRWGEICFMLGKSLS